MKKNYFKNLMQVSLLLGAAFVISSCDDIVGQEDNPVASYVQWQAKTPEEVTLKIGNTYTVKATAVSSAIIVYESENPEIAKVDPVTGEITAVAVGETNINAVVTGISTTGQSVFTPEKVSIKVIVKDGKASLTRAKDAVIEYTANKDSIIDLSKLFTAYPEATTSGETDKSTVTYSVKILNKAATTADKYETYSDPTKLGSKTATSTFKVGPEIEKKNYNKAICDTLYVIGQITSTNGSEYTMPTGTTAADLDIVMDTVKVIINKSIAYMNEKNERTILTADKYTTFTDAKAAEGWDGTLKAGTYFADTWLYTETPKISGIVSIILPNDKDWNYSAIDDAKDSSTLNIFRQAVTNKSADVPGIIRIGWIGSYPENSITNFKAINIYGGNIQFRGNIAGVGEINVYNEAKLTTYHSGFDATYNGKILLKDGGKLTVAGGTVDILGWGTDLNTGFAVIGDVEVSKGVFTASNSQYRAVKGNLTAGGKILIKESNDNNTWTALEGTTSTSKYIKAQDKSDTWK